MKHRTLQVFCFPFICGALGLKADKEWRFVPSATNQGWRFLSSLFIHAGILHFIIVLIINWTVGRPIEGAAGHIRIALVYFSGAIGGNLVGGFFDPYLPQVGCSGAVFGLIGVSFLEILQALAYEPVRYFCELLILCLVALGLIICGFFAFVSNWAHLGGLLFGVPMALCVMPHLCFNRWNCSSRKVIFAVALICLGAVLLIFLVLFYTIQDAGFCPTCYYFSCIPWTKRVCNVFPELVGSLSHD